MVTEVTHPGLRATALATVTLANNLLGFAPGPVLIGRLSDHYGLQTAMALAPLASLVAAACFALGSRHYERDLGHYEEPPDEEDPAPETGSASAG